MEILSILSWLQSALKRDSMSFKGAELMVLITLINRREPMSMARWSSAITASSIIRVASASLSIRLVNDVAIELT